MYTQTLKRLLRSETVVRKEMTYLSMYAYTSCEVLEINVFLFFF